MNIEFMMKKNVSVTKHDNYTRISAIFTININGYFIATNIYKSQ